MAAKQGPDYGPRDGSSSRNTVAVRPVALFSLAPLAEKPLLPFLYRFAYFVRILNVVEIQVEAVSKSRIFFRTNHRLNYTYALVNYRIRQTLHPRKTSHCGGQHLPQNHRQSDRERKKR